MSEQTFLRLYTELNAGRYDSDEAARAIASLGGPAHVVRGLALVRRHRWASARADFHTALDAAPVPALTELVAGVGLWAARAHDEALAALTRAARHGKPGLAKQARVYAHQFAARLGWTVEAHRVASELGIPFAAEPPIG